MMCKLTVHLFFPTPIKLFISFLADGFINLDDMLSIVDKLSENKNEAIELVDDEPSEYINDYSFAFASSQSDQ